MSFDRASVQFHGQAPDRIDADAPVEAWTVARNVIFRDGETRRANGDKATLPNELDTPRTMVFTEIAGKPFWVYAGDQGVFVGDGSQHWDITPAGWVAPLTSVVFSSCVLGGIVVVNLSDRDPVYFAGDTANPAVPLPGWPAGGRARVMRAHKNFLFALSMLNEAEERVRWSDAAEAGAIPATWAPAADNLAGFVDLSPSSAPVLEGMTLRDEFLIYKDGSIHAAAFVGGQFIFAFRKVFSQEGIFQTGAICRGPEDQHLFVGSSGDVLLTDGVRLVSVLEGKAQRTFYADLTAEPNPVLSGATLMREKLGLIFYPQSGGGVGTQALAYDFTSGDFGQRECPSVLCAAEGRALEDFGDANTWDGDSGVWDDDASRWDEELSAATNDDVQIGGPLGFHVVSDPAAQDFAQGAVMAEITKLGIAFGNAEARKLVRRVWPKVTGRTGDVLTFRLAGQEGANGPVSLGPPVPFVIGSGLAVDAFVTGRFLGMEITSNGGAPWRLGSLDIEFREVGLW